MNESVKQERDTPKSERRDARLHSIEQSWFGCVVDIHVRQWESDKGNSTAAESAHLPCGGHPRRVLEERQKDILQMLNLPTILSVL